MITTTYAGAPFIGSPFTAEDESTAPLIGMQTVSRNLILNQRSNGGGGGPHTGLSPISQGFSPGKKFTVSHDGPLVGDIHNFRISHDKSFKNGLYSPGKRPYKIR
jgi:hypothetical protein